MIGEQKTIREDDDLNNHIIPPFGISKRECNQIVDSYTKRTFTEEIDLLQNKYPIEKLTEALRTSIDHGVKEEGEQDNVTRTLAFGTNQPEKDGDISFCHYIWEGMHDKIIIVLIIAAIIKLLVGVLLGHDPALDWIDGFALIVAITIVLLVGAINNYTKEKEFRRLKNSSKGPVKEFEVKKSNNEWHSIPDKYLLVGDIIKIKHDMIITCDCILIKGSIDVDEFAVTEEIESHHKKTLEVCLEEKQKIKTNDLDEDLKRKIIDSPIVLSGSYVNHGSGEALILAVGCSSERGRIIKHMESYKNHNEGTPLQRKLEALAGKIGKYGLIAACITLVGMGLNFGIRVGIKHMKYTSEDSKKIVNIFIMALIVLVVAIPEGLPLAVALTLSFSIKKMENDNIMIRKMESCETMGGVNYICTEENGILTENKAEIVAFFDFFTEVDFSASLNKKHIKKKDYFTNDEEYKQFKIFCSCTSNTFCGKDHEVRAKKKTDIAYVGLLEKFKEDVEEIREKYLKEINNKKPLNEYTHDRKKISVVLSNKDFPTGYRVYMKGGPDLISSCSYYHNNNSARRRINNEFRDLYDESVKHYSGQNLKINALAYKDIDYKTATEWNKAVIKRQKKIKRNRKKRFCYFWHHRYKRQVKRRSSSIYSIFKKIRRKHYLSNYRWS